MPDDVDRYICDAGHEIGAVWPDDGECPLCECHVSIVLPDDLISFQLELLLDHWAAFYDATRPVVQATHILEVSNAMFALRPWLAKQSHLLRDHTRDDEPDPDFGGVDPAQVLDFIANWQPPTDGGEDGDD